MKPAEVLARGLLRDLGWTDLALPAGSGFGAAEAWARSGAAALTGPEEAPPVLPSAPLPSCAEAALLALRALAGPSAGAGLESLEAGALLGERAAIAGLRRRGRVSPGGSCRLLCAADGWLAVNLPRGEEDWRLVPAWLEVPEAPGEEAAWTAGGAVAWARLEELLRTRASAEVVERARWLGLAVAPVHSPSPDRDLPAWFHSTQAGECGPPAAGLPRVVDLSSLWAGPLCGHLLQLAGARVTKVESAQRPDGARAGPEAFFELLNGAKQQLRVAFAEEAGRQELLALLDEADLVIESARPRGLRQLGILAEDWLRRRPGRVWLSITGYGRGEPEESWVAFGDDAAAAGGLCWCVPDAAAPVFVADAVADPLTGIHAAAAALAAWRSGGGRLVEVPLAAVAARCAAVRHVARVDGWIEPATETDAGGSSLVLGSSQGRWSVASPFVARRPA